MSKSISSIGLGSILALVLSWTANHSVLWAIPHFMCGWFYVIYYVLFKYIAKNI